MKYGAWCLWVLTALAGAAGSMASAGEVLLDRAEIWTHGPVSGQIILEVPTTFEFVEFPGIRNGGVVITISCPSGETRIIDKESIMPGDSGDYGRRPMIKFEAGTYIVPFCLVKSLNDDYLFVESGRYSISIEFPGWAPGGSHEVSVLVRECENCGLDSYLQRIDYGSVLHPFSLAVRDSNTRLDDGPYRDMMDVIVSYEYGGLIGPSLVTGSGAPGKNDFVSKKRVADVVTTGVRLASVSGTNEGFWRFIAGGLGIEGIATEDTFAHGGTPVFYIPMR